MHTGVVKFIFYRLKYYKPIHQHVVGLKQMCVQCCRQAQQDSMVQTPVSDFFPHNSDFFITILNYFLIYVSLEALKGAFLKATESLLPGDRHREREKQDEKDSLFLSAYFVDKIR